MAQETRAVALPPPTPLKRMEIDVVKTENNLAERSEKPGYDK